MAPDLIDGRVAAILGSLPPPPMGDVQLGPFVVFVVFVFDVTELLAGPWLAEAQRSRGFSCGFVVQSS